MTSNSNMEYSMRMNQTVVEEFHIVLSKSSQTQKKAYYSTYIKVQNKKKLTYHDIR